MSITNKTDIIPSGTLCKIGARGLSISSDGYMMITELESSIRLYEKINLSTFPSFNDFKGETTDVFEGDIALIISFVGRPKKVKNDPEWFQYDVYKVLVNGSKREIFRQNLLLV